MAWTTWLRPEDAVSLVSLGGGVVVQNPAGRGFLPHKELQRVDLDDPMSPRQRDNPNLDTGKMTLGLMNLAALWALPRRPLDILTLTADDGVIEFDVSQRTWADEALVSPEAEARLIRSGESIVRIQDGSYRWIWIKRFTLPQGAPTVATDALRLLLGHPAYWDNYIGEPGIITPHMHGPYRLEAISVQTFDVRDAEEVRATLEGWVYDASFVDGTSVRPDQIEGDLDEVLRLAREADTRFELPDLGEEAWHIAGFILDKPFIEFVLIGPEDSMTLIVATGD